MLASLHASVLQLSLLFPISALSSPSLQLSLSVPLPLPSHLLIMPWLFCRGRLFPVKPSFSPDVPHSVPYPSRLSPHTVAPSVSPPSEYSFHFFNLTSQLSFIAFFPHQYIHKTISSSFGSVRPFTQLTTLLLFLLTSTHPAAVRSKCRETEHEPR